MVGTADYSQERNEKKGEYNGSHIAEGSRRELYSKRGRHKSKKRSDKGGENPPKS